MSGPRGEECRLCYYSWTEEGYCDNESQYYRCQIVHVFQEKREGMWCGEFRPHPEKAEWRWPPMRPTEYCELLEEPSVGELKQDPIPPQDLKPTE
jgi:hypothetical protein